MEQLAQLAPFIVELVQAAVMILGSSDILVPTFKFELDPGYMMMALDPEDQLQDVVAQPSKASKREQEKVPLPRIPP